MQMPIEIKGETYYNTSEACRHLGVSREALNNYVNNGRITRYKQGIGRTAYYKLADLDRLLEMKPDNSPDDD